MKTARDTVFTGNLLKLKSFIQSSGKSCIAAVHKDLRHLLPPPLAMMIV